MPRRAPMPHTAVRLLAAAALLGGPVVLALVVPAAPPEAEKFPPELVAFVPYQAGPVFRGGGLGAWDERIRERGWILREGGGYKLWYTGYDGSPTGLRRLGYATSADGIRWTRHPGNPLSGEQWVEDVTVVRADGRYFLFAEGRGDRAHLFTSADGVAWDRVGPLDIRRTDGRPIPAGPYGTPAVWREEGVWYLFYERQDLGVWLATSTDLQVWRHVRDEPVLTPGPGAYDRDLIALNQVVKHRGRYYAYYHGCARTGPHARQWSPAVATSADLLRWEKYPGNPLRPVAENRSSGILVHDGTRYRLYTMHPEVHLHVPAP